VADDLTTGWVEAAPANTHDAAAGDFV